LNYDTEHSEARAMRAKLEATKDRAEQAEAVSVYLDVVSGLDLSACPEDFAREFNNYLHEWRKFATVLADPKADTKREASAIDGRWQVVLAVAKRYGGRNDGA
jgi:hypothetical protein